MLWRVVGDHFPGGKERRMQTGVPGCFCQQREKCADQHSGMLIIFAPMSGPCSSEHNATANVRTWTSAMYFVLDNLPNWPILESDRSDVLGKAAQHRNWRENGPKTVQNGPNTVLRVRE